MANFELNFLFNLGHADSRRYTLPEILSIRPLTIEAKAGVQFFSKAKILCQSSFHARPNEFSSFASEVVGSGYASSRGNTPASSRFLRFAVFSCVGTQGVGIGPKKIRMTLALPITRTSSC